MCTVFALCHQWFVSNSHEYIKSYDITKSKSAGNEIIAPADLNVQFGEMVGHNQISHLVGIGWSHFKQTHWSTLSDMHVDYKHVDYSLL